MSMDEYLITKPDASFLLKVSGDSMIGEGIMEGDLVIVEKGKQPRNGDVVIAEVDGEWTMKYFKKQGKQVYLEAANPKYPIIKPKTELTAWGRCYSGDPEVPPVKFTGILLTPRHKKDKAMNTKRPDSTKPEKSVRLIRRTEVIGRNTGGKMEHEQTLERLIPTVILPDGYRGKILLVLIIRGETSMVALRSGDLWHREILRNWNYPVLVDG